MGSNLGRPSPAFIIQRFNLIRITEVLTSREVYFLQYDSFEIHAIQHINVEHVIPFLAATTRILEYVIYFEILLILAGRT